MPPIALALLKSAMSVGNETLDGAVNTEINFQSVLQNSDDFGEAAKAFMEKRKPVFTGN